MSNKHLTWMIFGAILLSALAARRSAAAELIFVDDFRGKLADGWSWEREDRPAWRVGPDALEVRVQPGNMWGAANNAKNVLFRPIPAPADAPVEISVTFSNAPTAQWEQANLVWFYDDSNMVKLGQELVTGRFSIVMGREETDRARTVAIIPLDDNTVELRLQAVKNRVRGQFRTRLWRDWRDVGECDLPVKGEPKASLHFYNGPPNEEHWIKVRNFAVRRLKPGPAGWPRALGAENAYRSPSGGIAHTAGTLTLSHGALLLVNDPRGLGGDGRAESEQRIFRCQDDSCGWSWDRRSSSSKLPILLGVGMGSFDPQGKDDFRLPLARFAGDNQPKQFEIESDVVTRLENDHGDHDLSAQIWLTAAQPGWPPTHRISVLFDWYGKQATGQTLNDGYRDYEYVESLPDSQRPPDLFRYRLKGFRGAPPKVNLRAFLADAAKRGMPQPISILGVWFGNEVWDGSRGGTLVTRLDFLLDDQRYSALPTIPSDRSAE
jgi:hypothetical protein